MPTAIWLDSIAAVGGVGRTLDEALARQTRSAKPVVTVLVVYDLPDRDCSAQASSGELTAAAGGEARYGAEFIEPLAAQLRAHASLRVAVVVEPDSLANIATNTSVAKCAAAQGVYERSIALAVRRLSMPNVWLYLDAAHAAWLGWNRNRTKIAQIYRDVLTEAGGADKIRGFATNVSNYDTLRGGDIARLEPSDPCPDELTYVEKLAASLAEVGIVGKGFLDRHEPQRSRGHPLEVRELVQHRGRGSRRAPAGLAGARSRRLLVDQAAGRLRRRLRPRRARLRSQVRRRVPRQPRGRPESGAVVHRPAPAARRQRQPAAAVRSPRSPMPRVRPPGRQRRQG